MLLAALPWTALAQTAATPAQNLPANYPAKPVRVVVPFTAGGPNDAVLRPLTQKFHELLGQPFVFDYRPGGGAVIGTDYVAKAPPDGYTLLVTSATNIGCRRLMVMRLAGVSMVPPIAGCVLN